MRRLNAKQGKKGSEGKVSNEFSKLNLDAAGIDAGSEEHWVAFIPDNRY